MRRTSALLFAVVWLARGAALTPPKLRLPELARPTRISADLWLIPGEDHFTGVVRIDLTLLQATPVVWLHARSLTFQDVKIRVAGADWPGKAEPMGGDFVAITADRDLPPGNATLRIAYTGEVSRTLTDGVFQQHQGDDWYIFTKFEPVTARHAFPCFDEPSYKIPWQLTLHVPAAVGAFSNSPVEAEHIEEKGMKAVRFHETKPLPSYLVAFAVGPLDVVTTPPIGRNRVPGRIIVPRGRASEAEFAAAATPGLIGLLENYYGTPYPYAKLDQVVVPLTTAWGAMENAGLIAYGDFLLSPKQEDTELRQRGRAHTMLHEMSHQWFGDLVTMSWWDDIWLNEAFASWISTKLLDEAHPDWRLRTEEASRSGVMQTDSLASARKIRQPIEAPGDIANAFDGITYSKGSAVIGMFENYVQPGVFQQTIRQYLKQHEWGNATSADLLSALDQVAGPGHGAAFATFLNQGGVPWLHVKLNCEGSTPALDVSQERFLPLGSAGQREAVWQVPLCVRWSDVGGEHSQCAPATKAADTIPLRGGTGCPAWVFADQNAAGYYAVAYDAKLFDNLSSQGMAKLTLAERASVLRDMQFLFSSGKSDARTALQAARGLSGDANRVIVEETQAIVGSVNALVPKDLRPNYARFVEALYGARARELGWKPKPGEPAETRLLRLSLVPFVAELGANPSLRQEAARLARQWLQDHSSVGPDIVGAVMQIAAFDGDRSFFDALVAQIRATKVKRERDRMITGLASFRDPAIEKSALDLVLNSDIDARELTPVLFSARRETRDIAWNFAQQNFDRLNAKLPGARGIPFGATLPFVAGRYCDEGHRAEVESFFASRIQSLSGGQRNLANVLERIRLCSARAEAVAPGLVAFLGEQ